MSLFVFAQLMEMCVIHSCPLCCQCLCLPVYICGVCKQSDVEKPEEVRLIDLDEAHSGEHTVFIMPPEEPQEPDGSECPTHYR